MMRRALTMKFAPGAYVFPGGKVDKSDYNLFHWNKYIWRNSNVDLPYKIAVLRELYEELGIIYASTSDRFIMSGARHFLGAVNAAKQRLRADLLVPFSHWITPEVSPRRFDTKFYLAPLLAGSHALHDGNEAISMKWVSPKRIILNWRQGKVPLMFPTRLNLMRLAESNTVADAIRAAERRHLMPTTPVVKKYQEGIEVTIPKSAGFAAVSATKSELNVESGFKLNK